MDMKISGSGTIPGGEYERVCISGSGKCHGNIRCKEFRGAGSAHCHGDVACTESFTVSGSGHIDGNVTAEEIRVSGSCHIGGTCEAENSAQFSGSCHIGGKTVSRRDLLISGSLHAKNDIEAEHAVIKGVVHCDGLLNAETVEMELQNSLSRINGIGGSKISIKPKTSGGGKSFSLFGWTIQRAESKNGVVLEVADSIEGDEITLAGVKAANVVGRTVVIGENCEIGTVRYSESVEIAESAKVGRTEKA